MLTLQAEYVATELIAFKDADNSGETVDTVEVHLIFASARHLVREEYYRYGFDGFIADVGGYLGLLLGHSILSIFSAATEMCKGKG